MAKNKRKKKEKEKDKEKEKKRQKNKNRHRHGQVTTDATNANANRREQTGAEPKAKRLDITGVAERELPICSSVHQLATPMSRYSSHTVKITVSLRHPISG